MLPMPPPETGLTAVPPALGLYPQDPRPREPPARLPQGQRGGVATGRGLFVDPTTPVRFSFNFFGDFFNRPDWSESDDSDFFGGNEGRARDAMGGF